MIIYFYFYGFTGNKQIISGELALIDMNELYQYSKEQWTNYAEEAHNLGFKYE